MNQCVLHPRIPAQLDHPVILMNFPFTLDTAYANNPGMVRNPNRLINYGAAFSQFLNLYHYLAKECLVYLLPSEGNYQDQVYVANLGAYLYHLKERNVVLISKYKSLPRVGEDQVGIKFFESMGYEVYQPPFYWEGEADLKFLRENIYISGYGIRTEREAHRWMEEHFDMKIVSLHMEDPRLYHLDCSLFPISQTKLLVNVSSFSKEGIKALEQLAEIIPIPEEFKYGHFTNSKRIGNRLLSNAVGESEQAFFRKVCSENGLEPIFFNLSEFWKSGADLSCLIMHLN